MKQQFSETCPTKHCEGTLTVNVKIDRQLQIKPVAVKCLHCKTLFAVNYKVMVNTEIFKVGEKVN